jgi:NAD(P)-dependent dehydrogenase (short-subunit alcohol dehydrogenase family)
MAGERPRAAYIAGSMGNAALMQLTRALGAESLDHGVRVVGINPGPIETERLVS